MSQSLMVLSKLPDTSKVPSNEKIRDLTQLVCPERTDTQVPVTVSRIMILPELKPTTIFPHHARLSAELWKETVRKQVPHVAERPVTTLTLGESSEL